MSSIDGVSGDNWEQHWSEFSESAQYNPAQDLRRQIIADLISKFSKSDSNFHLLDIGSGQGDLLSVLERTFPKAKLTGVELSQSGIDCARKKVTSAAFVKQDLLVPFEGPDEWNQRAEIAVCSEVLEHIEEPEILLKNVSALLSSGCNLIVTVPGGPRTPFDIYIGHRRHYTTESLSQLLDGAGFKTKYVRAYGFPFFNLYKLIVMLRGKKLIADVSGESQNEKGVSGLAYFVMKVFGWLFKSNLNFIPLGWQIVAVAEKKVSP